MNSIGKTTEKFYTIAIFTERDSMPMQVPRVGVAVFVIKANKILLGKRLGSHGAGTWSLPGGHLEFNESLEQCAEREVLEETGLVITNTQPMTFTNDVFRDEKKHYITIYMLSHYSTGIPTALEPTKCEGWEWFSWHTLPRPLFLPLENLIYHLEKNYNYPVISSFKAFIEPSPI
jgi:8-oxo-dGTP diphosphatase